MAAVDLDADELFDPDDLKVAENPHHRRVAEALGLAIDHELKDRLVCYRNMNWYPLDGGGPIAPDLMVLPPPMLPPDLKSYKQVPGGPVPGAVVEIPSGSDGWDAFRAKIRRLQRLGSVVYIASVEPESATVLRLGPDDLEPQPWSGRPMEELGGITCTVSDDGTDLVLRTTDGYAFSRADELVQQIEAERDAAQRERDAAQRERDALRAERDALAARLRELGR
jgi:hypothetical protein